METIEAYARVKDNFNNTERAIPIKGHPLTIAKRKAVVHKCVEKHLSTKYAITDINTGIRISQKPYKRIGDCIRWTKELENKIEKMFKDNTDEMISREKELNILIKKQKYETKTNNNG